LGFFSVLPLGLWAQDSGVQTQELNSENALNRLIAISAQLSTLNGKLQSELQDSRQSSRELQIMLEASRKELDGLRLELEYLKQELELLQSSSTGLSAKAESSQTELAALVLTLRKAESFLMSLELSFSAYRQAAERKIKTLSKEKTLWKWGCLAAGFLAAGFASAFALSR